MNFRACIRSIFQHWHTGLVWRTADLHEMLVAQYSIVETLGPASGMVS